MTSSWFFLSTLNYEARSATHQISTLNYEARSATHQISKLNYEARSTTHQISTLNYEARSTTHQIDFIIKENCFVIPTHVEYFNSLLPYNKFAQHNDDHQHHHRQQLGLNRPVKVSSNNLFKGLQSRPHPFSL